MDKIYKNIEYYFEKDKNVADAYNYTRNYIEKRYIEKKPPSPASWGDSSDDEYDDNISYELLHQVMIIILPLELTSISSVSRGNLKCF